MNIIFPINKFTDFFKSMNPGLAAAHPYEAHKPDECLTMFLK